MGLRWGYGRDELRLGRLEALQAMRRADANIATTTAHNNGKVARPAGTPTEDEQLVTALRADGLASAIDVTWSVSVNGRQYSIYNLTAYRTWVMKPAEPGSQRNRPMVEALVGDFDAVVDAFLEKAYAELHPEFRRPAGVTLAYLGRRPDTTTPLLEQTTPLSAFRRQFKEFDEATTPLREAQKAANVVEALSSPFAGFPLPSAPRNTIEAIDKRFTDYRSVLRGDEFLAEYEANSSEVRRLVEETRDATRGLHRDLGVPRILSDDELAQLVAAEEPIANHRRIELTRTLAGLGQQNDQLLVEASEALSGRLERITAGEPFRVAAKGNHRVYEGERSRRGFDIRCGFTQLTVLPDKVLTSAKEQLAYVTSGPLLIANVERQLQRASDRAASHRPDGADYDSASRPMPIKVRPTDLEL